MDWVTVGLVVTFIYCSVARLRAGDTGWRTNFPGGRCPKCKAPGLVKKSWVKVQKVVDVRRLPDYKTYLACAKCDGRFALHWDGRWHEVNDVEWSGISSTG